ncbi:hypothetical protein AK812_SmicGene39815 [Symbiodinium microadriaticum]|uniref:Uncharacterized protein n=1 Tax=Symbiodinium microadriaticum TaxID=2951 RepID=A0A1Q9CAK5_SYMMI|nr:hypothetical protein AK812_SmicGene39815 [Symbiodinium microadriaticum]
MDSGDVAQASAAGGGCDNGMKMQQCHRTQFNRLERRQGPSLALRTSSLEPRLGLVAEGFNFSLCLPNVESMRSVVVFHVIWGLAVSIRDSDMRLDTESLVHSDAKDECEEKLRKAIDENAKLVAESTSLRNTMEDVKDLKVKVDKLKGQLIPTAPNASNASATDDGDFGMGCCCRVGRCHRDEEGVDGTRAVEVPADRCCKQQFLSAQHCSSGWENASASDCTSAEMEMLERFNRTAVASENHQQSECQHELLAVWDGIQKWTDNLSLHGHWIHSIHSRHLSETIQARLFVTGFPFEDGAVGARLFGMTAGTKLLMSGMSLDSDAYKTWKSKEHAGELNRDTVLGGILLERLNGSEFGKCDLATMQTFWQTASTSFLNVNNTKPLLILINETLRSLPDTLFWKDEVSGISRSPPRGSVRLVTFQTGCLELVEKLSSQIAEQLTRFRAGRLRWEEEVTSLTCQTAGRDPTEEQRYLPPFWRAEKLREHGYGTRRLRALGYSAKRMWDVGYNATELREAGFMPVDLKGMYDCKELRVAGYSPKDLLPAGFSVRDLRIVNYSAREMKTDEVLAKDLKSGGYEAGELKVGGYTLAEMIQADFDVQELKRIGYAARDFNLAGANFTLVSKAFTGKELKNAGYRCLELHTLSTEQKTQELKGNARFQNSEEDIRCDYLEVLNCTLQDHQQANNSVHCLLSHLHKDPRNVVGQKFPASYLCSDQGKALHKHGIAASMLREAGYNASELLLGGCQVKDLMNAYTCTEIVKVEAKAAVQLGTLKKLGCNATELLEAGVSPKEMRDAKFQAQDLVEAKAVYRKDVRPLKDAGFDAKSLHQAGVPTGTLKSADFSAMTLFDAGVPPAELKDAGFDMKALLESLYNDRKFTKHDALAKHFACADVKSYYWMVSC